MEQFEKLYMFNPFTISNATDKEIGETYGKLQDKLNTEADTPYLLADNIEIYANMNFLLGEMIARLQREYDLLKNEISISENKQINKYICNANSGKKRKQIKHQL